MSRIDEANWARIGTVRITGDGLIARYGDRDRTDLLFIAIDGANVRHLLLRLNPEEKSLQDTESRGLVVETRELSLPDLATTRYIDVACTDPGGHGALNLIGDDIVDGLVGGKSAPADVVRRVLRKWRRFWKRQVFELLTREQQLGLFAELWFLGKWLLPATGPDAVQAWQGPKRSRHDFEWSTRSSEVKASTVTRAPVFEITSIEQLEPPDEGDLFLFGARLRVEQGGKDSLPAMVSEVAQHMEGDPGAFDLFQELLLEAGYSHEHAEEYATTKIRFVSSALYAVTDGFPRVVRADLPEHSSASIEQVKYTVNLSGHTDRVVAESPGEFEI